MNNQDRQTFQPDSSQVTRRGFVAWVSSMSAALAALVGCSPRSGVARTMAVASEPSPPTNEWSHTLVGPFTRNTKIAFTGATSCSFATPMDLELVLRPSWAAVMIRIQYEGVQNPARHIRIDLTLQDASGHSLTTMSRLTSDERILAANPPLTGLSGRTLQYARYNTESFDTTQEILQSVSGVQVTLTEVI